jgi:hypothetical protein
MDILDVITDYFGVGGLFNPELMEHDKVSNMVEMARAEITSLRAELEKAKKDGWISVDTALPDDEITFLSFSPVYGFQVNMFNIHGNGGLPKLSQLKITHWKPLPNPPKE